MAVAQTIAQADVIVPVYNALHTLPACLDSLRDSQGMAQGMFGVILIDDASPDPRVADYLQGYLQQHQLDWQLLHNASNQGFVETVNRGMQACSGDVILLNQDVILSPSCLHHLHHQATVQNAGQAKLATLTPLSNNAEIASIPLLCKNNPVPENIALMQQACLQAGPALYPEVPTGVGFCMYISRAALNELGYFDAEAFGHGYGEENDFCCRAAAAGWRNVLCDSSYAAHIGNQSFAELQMQPNQQALQIILNRYPDYMDKVRHFIATDPLAQRRQQIQYCYQKLLKDAG